MSGIFLSPMPSLSKLLAALKSWFLRTTNVQYLVIDVRALCGITVPFPLFLTITHLELFDFTGAAEESVNRVWANVSLIPRLTHLALNPHLQYGLSHATLWSYAIAMHCVFVATAVLGWQSPDWMNGAVFCEDYWALADTFLAARRTGTVDRKYPRLVTQLAR
ncbi:hypothetical protein C8R45DRAFT_1090836 [Mycena sanguinolenta]|nr:hypothetical protein C8R45DRAFT_1090836 [Mycena sanguinolenta]